uniref:Uncharacterized protein n=1 Tax=Lepeophtheirus salmonis TaxID=72036 RepID=A0A0K2V1X5_LEPSM
MFLKEESQNLIELRGKLSSTDFLMSLYHRSTNVPRLSRSFCSRARNVLSSSGSLFQRCGVNRGIVCSKESNSLNCRSIISLYGKRVLVFPKIELSMTIESLC